MKRQFIIGTKTVRIPLTRGYSAFIDLADLHIVDGYSWTAKVNPTAVYAWRAEKTASGTINVWMHRAILGAPTGILVDHKDGDGLNNRRLNLRLATHSQNHVNKGPQSNNTSGHKGVTWSKAAEKWQAAINIDGQTIYIDLFIDPLDASAAYQHAAQGMYGDFAYHNRMLK